MGEQEYGLAILVDIPSDGVSSGEREQALLLIPQEAASLDVNAAMAKLVKKISRGDSRLLWSEAVEHARKASGDRPRIVLEKSPSGEAAFRLGTGAVL